MTTPGEDKEMYPHLLFDKHIATGKILSTVLLVLAVMSAIIPFFISRREYSDIFTTFTGIINTIIYIVLLLRFRYYLLNFDLQSVRRAILALIIIMAGSFFIERLWVTFVNPPADIPDLLADPMLAYILSSFLGIVYNVAIWACYVFIGAKLYRYKGDFVGGLQPLGQVCFIVVATGIITLMLANLMEVFIGNSVTFPKATGLLNSAAYIYLLYVMRFTFASAGKYIEDSE